jgi:hydroxypyruvate isomerase
VPEISANLSMLFTELPFLQRFGAAAAARFGAVEFQFPYAETPRDVAAALRDAGLKLVLFNLPAGDWAGGDRGIAADPERVKEFRDGVTLARSWADALGCPQLNCLAGRRGDLRTLTENVRFAAEALGRDGRRLLVEACNPLDVPGFLLPRADAAAEVLCDNAWLQFDVYHEQRAAGNVVETFRRLAGRVGHVQVADCPGRHQPGTGELNWPFVLREIEAAGYRGPIGLEYVPEPDTMASLAALPLDYRAA